jgi:glycerol-3-phosphate acyltransferase PlsY
VTWLFLAVSYLIGAFPTSYLVARAARGIDLRQHGSGNLGATNAFRVLGWKAATPIFIVDILKGWFPPFFFPRWDGSPAEEWALAYGAAAILGHVYSVYVSFQGGKGVATGAGVFLALVPYAVAIGLMLWTALVLFTGYVSLASVVTAIVLPVLVLVFRGVGPVFWLSVALAIFVLYSHRANIGRLVRGEEHRFRHKTGEAK